MGAKEKYDTKEFKNSKIRNKNSEKLTKVNLKFDLESFCDSVFISELGYLRSGGPAFYKEGMAGQ